MRKACCNRIIFYNLWKQIMPLNCCTVQTYARSSVSPLTFVFKQSPAHAPQSKHNESKRCRIMDLTERGPKFEVIAIKIIQSQSSLCHKGGLYSETNNGQQLSAPVSINLLVLEISFFFSGSEMWIVREDLFLLQYKHCSMQMTRCKCNLGNGMNFVKTVKGKSGKNGVLRQIEQKLSDIELDNRFIIDFLLMVQSLPLLN